MFNGQPTLYWIALRFRVRARGFSAESILTVAVYLDGFYGEASCCAYGVVDAVTVRRGISALFYIRYCFLGRKSRAGLRVHRPSYKKVKVCDTIDMRNRRAQEPRSAAAMSPHRKKRAVFPARKAYLPFGNAGAKTFCFRRYFAKTARLYAAEAAVNCAECCAEFFPQIPIFYIR